MYCPYCGTSNSDEDELCRKCGKSIGVNGDAPGQSLKTSRFKVGWRRCTKNRN